MQHERPPQPDQVLTEEIYHPAHAYGGRHEADATEVIAAPGTDLPYIGKHRAPDTGDTAWVPAYQGKHYAAGPTTSQGRHYARSVETTPSPHRVARALSRTPIYDHLVEEVGDPFDRSRFAPLGSQTPIYDQLAQETGRVAPPPMQRPSAVRELPYAMAYDLAVALNEYTKLAAARERSALSFRASHRKVEVARERYEALRLSAKEWLVGHIDDSDMSREDWTLFSVNDDKSEARLAAVGIRFEAERQAEVRGPLARQRQKFYDWWARQGGGEKFFSRHRLAGTAKKAAVLGAVGLPVGVIAGATGAFVAGPVIGVAAAAGIARGVARGLLRGQIEKNVGPSVATAQFHRRLAAQYHAIEEGHTVTTEGRVGYPESATDVYAEATKKSVERNRRRMIGGIAIGLVTGLIGASLGDLIHNAIYGGEYEHGTPPATEKPSMSPPTQPAPSTPAPPPTTPAPSVPPEHGLTGQSFDVEPGSGEIREIEEYATAHHYNITPQDAFRIYTELYQEHGSNIIDLSGSGPDTYLISSGNVGLSHPGTANWYPGIEDELRTLLAQASATATTV